MILQANTQEALKSDPKQEFIQMVNDLVALSDSWNLGLEQGDAFFQAADKVDFSTVTLHLKRLTAKANDKDGDELMVYIAARAEQEGFKGYVLAADFFAAVGRDVSAAAYLAGAESLYRVNPLVSTLAHVVTAGRLDEEGHECSTCYPTPVQASIMRCFNICVGMAKELPELSQPLENLHRILRDTYDTDLVALSIPSPAHN